MRQEKVINLFIRKQNEKIAKENKNVALVTHGGVIEVILCIENGMEFTNKIKHFSAPNAKPIPVEITYGETTGFDLSVFY